MYGQVVFALGIDNVYSFAALRSQFTGITYLTTHLGIERRNRKHQLVIVLVFLANLTIAQDFGIAGKKVVAHKLRLTFAQHHPVAGLHGSSIARTLFLLLHTTVENLNIDFQPVFFQNKLGQVEGEAVGIVQDKGIVAADAVFSGGSRIGHHLVEQAYTRREGTQKSLFLLLDNLLDEYLLGSQFGIGHRPWCR